MSLPFRIELILQQYFTVTFVYFPVTDYYLIATFIVDSTTTVVLLLQVSLILFNRHRGVHCTFYGASSLLLHCYLKPTSRLFMTTDQTPIGCCVAISTVLADKKQI